MTDELFYLEHLSLNLNSYELKMFRVQHEETQLLKYLTKYAKKHEENSVNRIYLVRNKKTKQLVAWFGLKAATLPYNDKHESFLIPAIELTHIAVDERYHVKIGEFRIGEYIFHKFVLPIVKEVAQKVSCKDLYVFAIDNPKLINYYKERLGFKEINHIDDKQFFEYAAPDYDEGCKFLYYPL